MISKKRRKFYKKGKRKYSKKGGKKIYSKKKGKRIYSKKGGNIWLAAAQPQQAQPQQAQQMEEAAEHQRYLENTDSMLRELKINLSNQSGKIAQVLSNMYSNSMPNHPLFLLTKQLIPQVTSKGLQALWPLSEIIKLQVEYLKPDDVFKLHTIQPLFRILQLQYNDLRLNVNNILQLSTIQPLFKILELQFQQLKNSNDAIIINPRIEPLNSVLNLQIEKLHTITLQQYGLEQLEPLNSVLTLQFIKIILPNIPSTSSWNTLPIPQNIQPLGLVITGQQSTNYMYFLNLIELQIRKLQAIKDQNQRIQALESQKPLKDILDYQFDKHIKFGMSYNVEPLNKFYNDMNTIHAEKIKNIGSIVQSLSEKNKDENDDSLANLTPELTQFLEYWLNYEPHPTFTEWNFDSPQLQVQRQFYALLNQQFKLLAENYPIYKLPLLNYILDESPFLYNSYALHYSDVTEKMDIMFKHVVTVRLQSTTFPTWPIHPTNEPFSSVIKAQLKILSIDPSLETYKDVQLNYLKQFIEEQKLWKSAQPSYQLYPLNIFIENFDEATWWSLDEPAARSGGGRRVSKNKNIKLKKKIDLFKKNKKKYLIGGRNTLKQNSLPKSPCKGESERLEDRCDDSKYLKILSEMSTIQTNNITQHLLMRLHSINPSPPDTEISSLMPYIEIILDGIHDFKQYFTKEEFIQYCNAISDDQFKNVNCSPWLSEIYDSFSEDNLFVPFVKTNSAELIKNGEIWVYNENIVDTAKEAQKTELENLYISRDIWGGTKHDAGRGLSHIKSLDLLNSPVCPKDDHTHPKLVLKSVTTLIDPSPPTSLKLDTTFIRSPRNNINDIYDGYFEFFNEKLSGFKIRFKEYLDPKCKRVRFAIYLEKEAFVEEGWNNAKKDILVTDENQQIWQINNSVANIINDLIKYDIFLCNSGTYSTFTINNIQYSLKKFKELLDTKEFVEVLANPGKNTLTMQWVDVFFKNDIEYKKKNPPTHDPILLKFFCIIYLKFSEVRTNWSLFLRLGLTFKLIGDRGQAWWVWKYNKMNQDRKIILATGDRMLMIFAISIGIPAVWSAGPGKQHGLNYYYFPNTDSFEVQMVNPILPRDLAQDLSNYKTISNYEVKSIIDSSFKTYNIDTILKGIQPIRVLTQEEKAEILYNSCWRFVETTLPIDIINESRSMTQQPYDVFLAFLKYTLKMDPVVGKFNENKIINGLAQKTVGNNRYTEELKKKNESDFYQHITASGSSEQPLTIENFLENFINKFLPYQLVKRGSNQRYEFGSLFKIKSARSLMQKVLGDWDGKGWDDARSAHIEQTVLGQALLNNIRNIVLSNIKELYINHINNTIEGKLIQFIQNKQIIREQFSTIKIQNSVVGAEVNLKLTKLNTTEDLPNEEAEAVYTKLVNDNNYLRKTIKKALIIWASQNLGG